MKVIHFDNLYTKWYYKPILVLNAVLLIYVIITFGNGEYALEFLFISLLSSLILLARMFFFKTYVQDNSSRIFIRVNTTSGINLKFENITHIEQSEKELIIKNESKTHRINIEGINPKDIQRLVSLMVERSDAFYTDSSKLNYYEKN